VLVELGVVEQRYQAVREVLDGCAGDGGGAPVRGGAADGACVVASVCR